MYYEDIEEIRPHVYPAFKRFRPYYPDNEEPDASVTLSIREFTGKLTRARYKLIARYVRCLNWRMKGHCGHDWDCCGCLFMQSASFTYKHNQVSLIVAQHRNY